jgi:hypothetical protein
MRANAMIVRHSLLVQAVAASVLASTALMLAAEASAPGAGAISATAPVLATTANDGLPDKGLPPSPGPTDPGGAM